MSRHSPTMNADIVRICLFDCFPQQTRLWWLLFIKIIVAGPSLLAIVPCVRCCSSLTFESAYWLHTKSVPALSFNVIWDHLQRKPFFPVACALHLQSCSCRNKPAAMPFLLSQYQECIFSHRCIAAQFRFEGPWKGKHVAHWNTEIS